ncbi:MAG: hypothetical protein MJA29_08715, partial [Candidatus Omnitrophica bacterium]|nr:hypothetical protein [Candidatus Omnitrophota bacterium]
RSSRSWQLVAKTEEKRRKKLLDDADKELDVLIAEGIKAERRLPGMTIGELEHLRAENARAIAKRKTSKKKSSKKKSAKKKEVKPAKKVDPKQTVTATTGNGQPTTIRITQNVSRGVEKGQLYSPVDWANNRPIINRQGAKIALKDDQWEAHA